MATNPSFASTPRVSGIVLSSADSSLTAPTGYGVLMTAGNSGTKINEIVAHVAVTGLSTASVVRLFLHDGTNYTLFDTIALAAATSSSSVSSTRVSNTYSNLVLPSGIAIRASTSVSQSTAVTALGGDL